MSFNSTWRGHQELLQDWFAQFSALVAFRDQGKGVPYNMNSIHRPRYPGSLGVASYNIHSACVVWLSLQLSGERSRTTKKIMNMPFDIQYSEHGMPCATCAVVDPSGPVTKRIGSCQSPV
jgi:hypothetical protein